MENKEYIKRLVDENIQEYLKVFGAILIEGPKWCGKTWTSKHACNSYVMLTDDKTFLMVNSEPTIIFNTNTYLHPLLIDEWQRIPKIWDLVRNECDNLASKGNFILTGSTKLINKNDKQSIYHSGTGRISRLKMYPMSSYEQLITTNDISIIDMMENKIINKKINKTLSIETIAKLIVKGGWPQSIDIEDEKLFKLIPKEYINSLVSSDIKEFGNKSNKKMLMILKSLARNESTIVSEKTILNDVNEQNTNIKSALTINEYLDILRNLFVLIEDDAFDINFRSSKKVGKSPKKHLVDPSLSCAALNLDSNKLLTDFNTFGFMFEALVERDLRIYANYLGGKLYHFRDNSSYLEIDAIIELSNGYGAIEIKLGVNDIDIAKQNLLKFYKNVKIKPKFLCVIVGNIDYITVDENGIYVIPFYALKPK